jgi:hypothetical protein
MSLKPAVGGRLHVVMLMVGLASPSLGSAEEIRVFFVASRDRAVDARIVALEQAVAQSRGPLAVAESVSDAHVVLQVTDYKDWIGRTGGRNRRWRGHASLLRVPDGMRVSATPIPEDLELRVGGDDGKGDGGEVRLAAESLARLLTQTLRKEPGEPDRDPV